LRGVYVGLRVRVLNAITTSSMLVLLSMYQLCLLKVDFLSLATPEWFFSLLSLDFVNKIFVSFKITHLIFCCTRYLHTHRNLDVIFIFHVGYF
jgi:hypothetical protein